MAKCPVPWEIMSGLPRLLFLSKDDLFLKQFLLLFCQQMRLQLNTGIAVAMLRSNMARGGVEEFLHAGPQYCMILKHSWHEPCQ